MDYKINVIILDGSNKRIGSDQREYHEVVEFLKDHLRFVKENIHQDYKFLHILNNMALIFVGPSAESIQSIKEHMRRLNRNDDLMSITFDDETLTIIIG